MLPLKSPGEKLSQASFSLWWLLTSSVPCLVAASSPSLPPSSLGRLPGSLAHSRNCQPFPRLSHVSGVSYLHSSTSQPSLQAGTVPPSLSKRSGQTQPGCTDDPLHCFSCRGFLRVCFEPRPVSFSGCIFQPPPRVGPAPGAVSFLEAHRCLGKGGRSADLSDLSAFAATDPRSHTFFLASIFLSEQYPQFHLSMQEGTRSPHCLSMPTPSLALSQVLPQPYSPVHQSPLEGLLDPTSDFLIQQQVEGWA